MSPIVVSTKRSSRIEVASVKCSTLVLELLIILLIYQHQARKDWVQLPSQYLIPFESVLESVCVCVCVDVRKHEA